MKLQLPRRRLWRIVIYLLSLWLIVTAIDLVLVQTGRTIHPGYQTTRILTPTLSDGRIDYLVAVDQHFGIGVTPENNAAIPALRVWGRWALSPNQPRDGVTQRLGMEPLPEKGDYFVEYNEKNNHDPSGADDRDLILSGTWPLKITPPMREWMTTNERSLRRLTDASLLPRFFIPFYAGNRPETMVAVLLTHVIPLRETSRALLIRAAIRLDAGDVAGFRDDVMAVHRWARLLSQTPTLVERLVAIALETNACRMDRLAAASGKLPPADARALAADLQRLGDLPSPSETVDAGERYFILETCQWMARGGPRNVAIFLDQLRTNFDGTNQVRWWSPALTTFLPVQFDNTMRSMNAFYDGAIVAWREQPTWASRREAMHLWETEIQRQNERNILNVFLSGNWPAIYLLPSLTHIMEVSENALAEIRLTRVALALAAYKSEHGSYPPSLADLPPDQTPADPFTDKPFSYARTANAFTLYSVGPNMTDDNGNSQKPADDIPASPARRPSPATAPTSP